MRLKLTAPDKNPELELKYLWKSSRGKKKTGDKTEEMDLSLELQDNFLNFFKCSLHEMFFKKKYILHACVQKKKKPTKTNKPKS